MLHKTFLLRWKILGRGNSGYMVIMGKSDHGKISGNLSIHFEEIMYKLLYLTKDEILHLIC